MPATHRLAPGTFFLAAIVLAALPMPVAAAQTAAHACSPAPVLGRAGDILYWTSRPGCAAPLAAASGDGPSPRNAPTARQSDSNITETPIPVSGVAVDTPVMR